MCIGNGRVSVCCGSTVGLLLSCLFPQFKSEPFLPYRLEAGLLLREAKELWRVGMDLACVEEMVQRRLNKRVGAAAGAPHEETPAAVMDRYRCVQTLIVWRKEWDMLRRIGRLILMHLHARLLVI